ncbi:MAG: AEC family transporter [Pseudomonadota bacterium]
MQALFEVVLPVFVVIGVGYAATWKGLFSESAVDGLTKFAQNFAIPCLLFGAISRIELGVVANPPLILAYYIGAFTSFFIGFVGARTLFDRSPADAVAIGFCCFFSNTVLLGLPITERAYGPEALPNNFAIIAFHAPLCYMLGVTAMEVAQNRSSTYREMVSNILSAMFRNPFVLSILLGFAVNISRLPVPDFLTVSVDIVAQSALPAALFALGGMLVQYKPEGDQRTILMVCAVSLILHPALVLGLGKVFGLDQSALRSAIITAAMAPGVNTYIFANLYGTAKRVAAASVLVATAASLITVWFWLTVLG